MKPERPTKQRNNKNFLLANKIPLGVHSFHETLLACWVVVGEDLSTGIFRWQKNYANESKRKFGFNVVNILTKNCVYGLLAWRIKFQLFSTRSISFFSLLSLCVGREKSMKSQIENPLRNLSSEFFTPTIGGDSSGLLESFCGWQFWFTKDLGWRERIFLFGDYFSTNSNVEISSVERLTIFINHFLFKNIFNSAVYSLMFCSTSCR